MNNLILDPISFFRELGGLHDSEVNRFTWDATARTITLDVDDLNANFDGLPEYPGKRQASVVFANVENILLSCDAIKGDVQRIYKLAIQEKVDQKKYELVLRISPSGQLNFDCEIINIVDVLTSAEV